MLSFDNQTWPWKRTIKNGDVPGNSSNYLAGFSSTAEGYGVVNYEFAMESQHFPRNSSSRSLPCSIDKKIANCDQTRLPSGPKWLRTLIEPPSTIPTWPAENQTSTNRRFGFFGVGDHPQWPKHRNRTTVESIWTKCGEKNWVN